ncbi:MAG: SUMF1/EgtB/PvdO family nonheme iron enzyme [Anaerolineales bacterium]|nr:SUMF1/EgtB/PvdO family nonheme iron enzyme [Anaerolineales bacterium]
MLHTIFSGTTLPFSPLSSRKTRVLFLLFTLWTLLSACASTTGQEDQSPTRLPPAWTATPGSSAVMGPPIPAEVPTAAPDYMDPGPPARSENFEPPPATAEAGNAWKSAVDGKTMLYIPAGASYLGARDDYRLAEPDERPQNRITLDAFWIADTEVTNAEYEACVGTGACSTPIYTGSATREEYFGESAYADYPVLGVRWYQARDYCAWVGGSLPSEGQWEKAARSHDGRRYPWEWVGSVYNGRQEIRLNYCDAECTHPWADNSYSDGYADTAPVGSYPAGASPYGVLDMAGNVWEWTNDWYANAAFKDMVLENPTGPDYGLEKVIKGGSWMDGLNDDVPVLFRSSNRAFRSPVEAYNDLGFRCVLPAGEP